MNSRKALIVVLLIVVLFGGGYFLYTQNSKKTAPTAASTQQTGGNVFASIKDALSKSLSLKCDYPDSKGNTVTTYIKAGAVRVMGYSSGSDKGTGQTLMKDNKMYIWDDKTKKGTVIAFNRDEIMKTVDSMKKEAVEKTEEKTPNQGGDFLKSLEQYKNYCKPANVSDSLFAVPADVKFVDLAEQMKKSGIDIEKMMQQVQTTVTPPSGY